MTSSSFIGLLTMAIDPHPIKVQDSLLPIERKLLDKRKMVEETNNSKRIKKSKKKKLKLNFDLFGFVTLSRRLILKVSFD